MVAEMDFLRIIYIVYQKVRHQGPEHQMQISTHENNENMASRIKIKSTLQIN